jgi:hypothetical protein
VGVLRASTHAELEVVLDAAGLDEFTLTSLIKEVGSRTDGNVHALDWPWAWATEQTKVTLDVFHFNAYISQLARRKRRSDALAVYAGNAEGGGAAQRLYVQLPHHCVREERRVGGSGASVRGDEAGGGAAQRLTYSALVSSCEKSGRWE